MDYGNLVTWTDANGTKHVYRKPPGGAEQHGMMWSSWIGRTDAGWQVCFNNILLDVMFTREQARARIQEYKANPGLAVAAQVDLA